MYSISNYKEKIDVIEIDNGLNLKARLCNFGAGLLSLYFDTDPLILELKNIDDYLYSSQYYGKTLGPVAGRLYFKGDVNGKEYTLETNNEAKDYSLLGGGKKALSYKLWKYKVKESKKKIDVVFSILTKDGEAGYIGKALIKVIYSFSKIKNSFKIHFLGNVKEDTLLNLSNHTYWNFASSKDLSDYKLKINADRACLMRDDLLIYGVDDIPAFIDFRNFKKIKTSDDFIRKNVSVGTIDHTFVFENDKKPSVILKNDKYVLKMTNNYPAMNIYLDNSLTDVKFKNRDDFTYRRGIALEPQFINLDHRSIEFLAGDTYDKFIEYKIERA